MFEVEIDKFKRVLAMKQYKLIREQRELHPDLDIADTNDTFSMLVWRKDPHKRKYNTMIRLEASTINNNMKYVVWFPATGKMYPFEKHDRFIGKE